MRIVSLNAWGGALYDELAGWLPGVGADVLCLQETTRTSGLDGWTTFTDDARVLPQRADLVDDVRALMPGHVAMFDASDAGPVVTAGGRFHQEFGLGLFVASRLNMLERRARHVHGAFTDHDDWPSDDRPRVAQAVRIADESRTVLLVHVHGLRVGAGKQDTPERLAQAGRLGQLVDDVREPGDLVVLCGDLNLLPTSGTFAILAEHGLVDLVGDADTRTTRYPKAVRHASYLLVSDVAAVHRFEILTAPEVSDHRALVLDV